MNGSFEISRISALWKSGETGRTPERGERREAVRCQKSDPLSPVDSIAISPEAMAKLAEMQRAFNASGSVPDVLRSKEEEEKLAREEREQSGESDQSEESGLLPIAEDDPLEALEKQLARLQKKMAEILDADMPPANRDAELTACRNEIAALQQRIDDMKELQHSPAWGVSSSGV